MSSVRIHICWLAGIVVAMVVLGAVAPSPATETGEKVPVASTTIQKVRSFPRTASGQVAGASAFRVTQQSSRRLDRVDLVKASRQSAPSHIQNASLTFEELGQLERRLNNASRTYWDAQLNPIR